MLSNWFLSTPPSRVATILLVHFLLIYKSFYPRHPRGWRRYGLSSGAGAYRFYPRHPRGWRPIQRNREHNHFSVSIHATLAGGDQSKCIIIRRKRCFYPRHPRGWRPFAVWALPIPRIVSIHATLAGGDFRSLDVLFLIIVSIHATLAGGDIQGLSRTRYALKFLSTPPSRVATPFFMAKNSEGVCFYPRHPRGWRRAVALRWHYRYLRFYPRHPRGWRLPKQAASFYHNRCFYPRHPRGWRLKSAKSLAIISPVSIHATLAGGDATDFASPRTASTVSIHATLAGGDDMA